jgi:outer membrane protein TolC
VNGSKIALEISKAVMDETQLRYDNNVSNIIDLNNAILGYNNSSKQYIKDVYTFLNAKNSLKKLGSIETDQQLFSLLKMM